MAHPSRAFFFTTFLHFNLLCIHSHKHHTCLFGNVNTYLAHESPCWKSTEHKTQFMKVYPHNLLQVVPPAQPSCHPHTPPNPKQNHFVLAPAARCSCRIRIWLDAAPPALLAAPPPPRRPRPLITAGDPARSRMFELPDAILPLHLVALAVTPPATISVPSLTLVASVASTLRFFVARFAQPNCTALLGIYVIHPFTCLLFALPFFFRCGGRPAQGWCRAAPRAPRPLE
ncbi:hypothetical protein BCR44DRAFT_31476 [Catenaria anguillulae PL171]|uniref:Uncharacterized protein n=1 Tax=Catenaria anguillulae PL171 TaxID=765915 RepID=A0A1Y2HV37_9FUNG|nr:hypothetical protein BCR44DRAFT_31476 [Catenaria anguillulae PL171]